MPAASSVPLVLDLAVIRRRPVVAVLEERFGRPIRGRLLASDQISRVRPPGLGRLQTTGPLTHRHVLLEDSLPPHLPVAVAWSLTVEGRLPVGVRVGLVGAGEPLDRLLSIHLLPWSAELTEDVVVGVASEASADFSWAAPGTPLVEVTRVLHTAEEPVAITIDEVPLLPRVGVSVPLQPRPR